MLDDGGDLVGETPGSDLEVAVEIEVEGRVHEDRDEARAGRRLLGLGPASFPVAFETEARGDADDGPTPVLEMEKRGGTADGLVIGVRRDMDERGRHNQGD